MVSLIGALFSHHHPNKYALDRLLNKNYQKMKDKEITYKDYVPRDVSWMFFNRRILQEAMKPHVPLLERLGFLGIYSNNLDEFFRVRVALLNQYPVDEKEIRNRLKGFLWSSWFSTDFVVLSLYLSAHVG